MKLLSSISIVFLLSFTQLFTAQVLMPKGAVDLGVINETGADFVDVPLKNASKDKCYIFRADVGEQFLIQYSGKTILPDSTVYIRILYTPERKGSFEDKILIHFSCFSEPQLLKVEGYVQEIPKSKDISCPSFAQQQFNTSLENEFTMKVIDAETGRPIPEATVIMVQNGLERNKVLTKKEGTHTQKLMLGYYYFVAKKEGYESNELGMYVNRKNNSVVIPLKKMPQEILEITPEDIALIEEPPVTIINEESSKEILVEVPPVIEAVPIIEIEDDIYPDFSLTDYKPNNLVFLVDVSSSMLYGGKLDLLKASMIELTSMLRDVDKITLVSYAGNAKVLMETTTVKDADSIIAIIQELNAKGMTAGGKGMTLAFDKAVKSFMNDGNNQIIMATDGVFNMGDEDVNKLAKKFKKKGITVSVVGIKNRDIHKEMMQKLADDGGGSYINIETYEQAQQSLVDEIKKQSKKAQ